MSHALAAPCDRSHVPCLRALVGAWQYVAVGSSGVVVADLYYNVYYKEMLCKHQLLIFTTMFTMWEAEEQNMKQSFFIGPIVMNI